MINDYRDVFAAIKGRGSALPASNWYTSSGSNSVIPANFSRHQRTELDSCLLIPEYSGPVRFGTMMDDYRDVFAAIKGRGRALPASNVSISNPGDSANFSRHRRTELDSCLLIPEYSGPIRFNTLMDG
jgi:hypothetical protein